MSESEQTIDPINFNSWQRASYLADSLLHLRYVGGKLAALDFGRISAPRLTPSVDAISFSRSAADCLEREIRSLGYDPDDLVELVQLGQEIELAALRAGRPAVATRQDADELLARIKEVNKRMDVHEG